MLKQILVFYHKYIAKWSICEINPYCLTVIYHREMTYIPSRKHHIGWYEASPSKNPGVNKMAREQSWYDTVWQSKKKLEMVSYFHFFSIFMRALWLLIICRWFFCFPVMIMIKLCIHAIIYYIVIYYILNTIPNHSSIKGSSYFENYCFGNV